MAISPRIEMPANPLTPTVSPRTTHIVIGISVLASRTTSVVLAAPLPFFVPVIDAPVARISSAIRVRRALLEQGGGEAADPERIRREGVHQDAESQRDDHQPPGTRRMNSNMGTTDGLVRKDSVIAASRTIGRSCPYVSYVRS
jgi:hypothetical protein